MTNKRERISGVDTAWLRMEHPTNLMMIVGVMTFDAPLALANVKRIVAARFLAYRRFGQKAVQDPSGAWWEADADFDIDSHVHRVALPGKGDKAELEALVSDLASTPLDFSKPLWQFHLVEKFGGGSALITRIHHCYADGIALVQVMLSLTHTTAAGSLEVEAEPVETAPAPDADFWEKILRPVAGMLDNAALVGKGLLEQGKALAADPQLARDTVTEVRGAVQGAAGKAVDFAGEVAKLVTMGQDTPTRFKGALGVRKRVAWTEPLPLDEVKVMGKALGCSINDVLLSMAAGALRDYLEEHGDPVDGVEIRAVVPVNLRPQAEAHKLGNQFGLVFLDLPVGTDHPLERLYELRRRMTALKGSYQPLLALGLLTAVGYGPRIIQDQVTQLLGQNASAVMTNVPGPQAPLYFAGRRIAELNFWVPQSGSIGMGVSILSYNGRIQFGVITDVGLVPDPESIVDRFALEYEKLMWLTLMSLWGEDEGEVAPSPQPAAQPAAAPAKPAKRKAKAAPAQAPAGDVRIPKRFRTA
jgi:diacylglycerol O-acyltransferase